MKGVLLKDFYIAKSNILVTIVSLIVLGFGLSKSFPICRTISYYIEAYTLINRSFEFHFMKTV